MESRTDSIEFLDEAPTAEEYIALREAVGFSPRSAEAARRGLPGSLYAVSIRDGGEAVGMARIVGDGGCSFLVVDVIVRPDYQGRGLGTALLDRLSAWIDAHVPPGGMVSLLADEPGRRLYERYGFRYTAPESLGMKKHIPLD